MNIKKTFLFLLTFFIYHKNLPLVSHYNNGQLPPPPSAEEIEEIMSNPEFQKMMTELEKVFEEIDEEDDLTPTKKNLPKPSQITPIGKTTKIPEKPKSKDKQFLEDVIPQVAKNRSGKIVNKLSKEKIESFNYYINKFIRAIVTIEKKINSFTLGIAFKELMEEEGLIDAINKIVIDINLIKSKRLYQKAFFLPLNNELRKTILETINYAKKLLREIGKKENKEAEESETIDFLKKAAVKTKIVKLNLKKIKLSPLQIKLQKLFKTNIKPIETKINTIAKNVQVKEEIEKKKKIREEAAKRASLKQRQYPRYNQMYPSYGSSRYNYPRSNYYKERGKTYSGPPRGYRGYYKSHPSNYSTYNPLKSKKTLPKIKKAKSKPQKSRNNLTSQIPENMTEKLNKIENLTQENIKLLNNIKTTYNPKEENKSLKEIYKSKDLKKIANNFKEIEVQGKSLSPDLLKRVSQDNQLIAAIDQFIPIGIKLAKNPLIKKQKNAVLDLINLSPDKKKIELKKYEDKERKKIKGKEILLTSPTTKPREINDIAKTLIILNSNPISDKEKIDKINKQFEKQYKIAEQIRENFATRTITQITNNIGNQIPLRVAVEGGNQPIELNNGQNIIQAIKQTDLSDELKTAFEDKIKSTVGADKLDAKLNLQQKNLVKKVMAEFSVKIKEQKEAIESIGNLFEKIKAKEE